MGKVLDDWKTFREMLKGQRATRLRRLVSLAQAVARDAKETPLVRMSLLQQKALNAALRQLDFSNHYALGDRLRRAFGVEIPPVRLKPKMKRIVYFEDDDL